MRIMLISDNEKTTKKLKSFCKNEGYFLVVYHLPLKALDNLSEISPNILIVNAIDFPRHWKIIFQCLNINFINLNIKKVLIVSQSFSDNETKKANFLQADLLLQADKNSELANIHDIKNLCNSTQTNSFIV